MFWKHAFWNRPLVNLAAFVPDHERIYSSDCVALGLWQSLHNILKFKKNWFCYVLLQSVLLMFLMFTTPVFSGGAFHRWQAANDLRDDAIYLRQKWNHTSLKKPVTENKLPIPCVYSLDLHLFLYVLKLRCLYDGHARI